MIPLEIAKQTTRVSAYDPKGNQSGRETEAVDLVSEIREEAMIKQQAVKALLAAKYSKKIEKRDLEKGFNEACKQSGHTGRQEPGSLIKKRHSNNPKGNTKSGRTKFRRSTPD
ncbi:hypothetical protein PIB30_073338 [Stylosanthes scabra]|uniref:Uncharacterized protein n=1 Tax=Stylosanthes scabra TaxID=79078 RepID=A0ABU6VR82_9FABA|nr:hypothetical protein [Stylosanthes scabra]